MQSEHSREIFGKGNNTRYSLPNIYEKLIIKTLELHNSSLKFNHIEETLR